jgi:folylpolyglutamate synthase/dihydropteroate synthase
MASALTYAEALAYLAQFINYETRQPVSYDSRQFNLRAFDDFLQTLGSPHRAFPSVHIAGAKGKGSTAAMIAAMLSQAGLRTGLFTTPHLVTMRERTQIDRQLISREEFAALAPIAHAVIVTRYHNPRAYDPHILAEIAQRHGVAVQNKVPYPCLLLRGRVPAVDLKVKEAPVGLHPKHQGSD